MSANEATLRRLMASLAKQSEEDIEDVLKRLDPVERKALAPLLVKHGLAAPLPEPPPPPPRKEAAKPELLAPAGVSPWLAQRIAGVGERSVDGAIRMTPLALETLRAVAAEAVNEPEEPREAPRWRLFKKKNATHLDERA